MKKHQMQNYTTPVKNTTLPTKNNLKVFSLLRETATKYFANFSSFKRFYSAKH